MPNLIRAYAQAYISYCASHKHISKNTLLSLLRRRGHVRLFSAVIRELTRMIAQLSQQEIITVRCASKEEEKQIISQLQRKYSNQEVRFSVDETLIAGSTIKTRYTHTDTSAKRQLLNIYRSLTTIHG